MITPISEVIPEKNIFILSPHYDDAPLTFGGYLDALIVSKIIQNKKIRIIQIFSKTNYQTRDDKGNKDISLKRIQYATGIRLLEDLNCLDDLIGHLNYTYEIKAEPECLLREKKFEPDDEFEFLPGNKNNFEEKDWQSFNQIKKYAHEWLSCKNTAILIPMAMKEHVDHVILRDAVMEAHTELGNKVKATIYLGEDQPYTGLADTSDWNKANAFFSNYNLTELNYCINEKRKAALLSKHYPTQFEESYSEGVLKRATQLKEKYNASSGVERLYRIKNTNVN